MTFAEEYQNELDRIKRFSQYREKINDPLTPEEKKIKGRIISRRQHARSNTPSITSNETCQNFTK
jgi:hypothetical protein